MIDIISYLAVYEVRQTKHQQKANQGLVAQNLPSMITATNNIYYHGDTTPQPIMIKDSVVVTIDSKVNCNVSFMQQAQPLINVEYSFTPCL